jgi:hypothetical protein
MTVPDEVRCIRSAEDTAPTEVRKAEQIEGRLDLISQGRPAGSSL